MRFLKTNTATRITVGPFFDKTDGVTPETGITVTSCKLTLTVDDGGVPTLVLDTNPTASGGANDMVHITGDDAGFYDLELAAGNVNYVGRAMLAITDAAVHCPVFHEFMILPANIYDSLVGGTDVLDVSVTQWLGTAAATPTVAGVPEVDVTHFNGTAGTFASGIPAVNATQISGDATAADNAESFFDGTGYAGTNNVIPTVTTLAAGAITSAVIATGAIDADAISADFATELRTAINGGDWALSTDSNGRIRIVDGTGAGEINTASGVVQAALADGVTHGGSTADLLLRDLSFGGDWNVVGAVVFDNAGNDIRGITPTTASKTGYALSSTGMDSVTLPANIITASSIATDAIGAAELAADAATEIATAVWALATRTLTAATNISGPIADQVWEEALADHSATSGSTAAALNAAGSAGDPWATALPGAYGAGTAGKIIGDNLNATISSRASQTSVDTIDGIVDAILVDTAEIGVAGAGLTAADDAVIAAIAALNNISSAQVTAAVWHADVAANDNTVGSFGDFFGQTYQAATVDIQTQIAALNDISAADVWAAATRSLTDKAGFTISGTITTLDALDTAQDAKHDATKADTAAILLDTGTDGVVVATGSKTGYTLASSHDLYHADINFAVDEANTRDEYTVTWFKNGVRQTSVSSGQIQVVKRADGTDLIAATNMTQIASTGSWKYDATTTARTTAGEAVLVIVTATVDAGTRTFSRVVSRDSEAA